VNPAHEKAHEKGFVFIVSGLFLMVKDVRKGILLL
jgi:hypothetical protein